VLIRYYVKMILHKLNNCILKEIFTIPVKTPMESKLSTFSLVSKEKL